MTSVGALLVAATVLAVKPGTHATVQIAELAEIMAAVKAPGAPAVVVNVWATWCEPCRQEMPELLRFYRDHRGQGLRLILISADDDDQREQVARVLTGLGFDERAFIKRGDDMKFIDALDPSWKGALPATFLFDGRGARSKSWLGLVSYGELCAGVAGLLPPDKPGRACADKRRLKPRTSQGRQTP
jgi:thiol-disulfide isomerase/thioredoxin